MEKKTFFVVEQREKSTGKYYAYAEKVSNCNNLMYYFKPFHGYEIVSINACDTWKQAQEIATFWNDGAKKNNNYAFA